MRHLRVNLKHVVHGGGGKVTVECHKSETFLTEMLMLREVLQATCAHVNVGILEQRQQLDDIVIHEILHARLHK